MNTGKSLRLKMNIKLFGLFLSFIVLVGFKAPKSNNNDLRIKKEIFVIKEFSEKSSIIYKLETSITGQYNIEISRKNKILSNRKVDTEDAQKMDDQFVDRFISFKYIMKEREAKKCKNQFFLSLRGEEQIICSDEEDKVNKMKAFIDILKNQFS